MNAQCSVFQEDDGSILPYGARPEFLGDVPCAFNPVVAAFIFNVIDDEQFFAFKPN